MSIKKFCLALSLCCGAQLFGDDVFALPCGGNDCVVVDDDNTDADLQEAQVIENITTIKKNVHNTSSIKRENIVYEGDFYNGNILGDDWGGDWDEDLDGDFGAGDFGGVGDGDFGSDGGLDGDGTGDAGDLDGNFDGAGNLDGDFGGDGAGDLDNSASTNEIQNNSLINKIPGDLPTNEIPNNSLTNEILPSEPFVSYLPSSFADTTNSDTANSDTANSDTAINDAIADTTASDSIINHDAADGATDDATSDYTVGDDGLSDDGYDDELGGWEDWFKQSKFDGVNVSFNGNVYNDFSGSFGCTDCVIAGTLSNTGIVDGYHIEFGSDVNNDGGWINGNKHVFLGSLNLLTEYSSVDGNSWIIGDTPSQYELNNEGYLSLATSEIYHTINNKSGAYMILSSGNVYGDFINHEDAIVVASSQNFDANIINQGEMYLNEFAAKEKQVSIKGDVDNQGTIVGSATIEGSLSNSGYIYGKNYNYSSVDNSGSIYADNVTITNNITNTGKIRGDNHKYNALDNGGWMRVDGLSIDGAVSNSGAIHGQNHTYGSLDNQGNVYVDDLTILGDTINGSGAQEPILPISPLNSAPLDNTPSLDNAPLDPNKRNFDATADESPSVPLDSAPLDGVLQLDDITPSNKLAPLPITPLPPLEFGNEDLDNSADDSGDIDGSEGGLDGDFDGLYGDDFEGDFGDFDEGDFDEDDELEDQNTILGENITYKGNVTNYGMILGSNLNFGAKVFNKRVDEFSGGWIIGDHFVFSDEVLNESGADIVGARFEFQNKLINHGTIDIVTAKLADIENYSELTLDIANISGDVLNNGYLELGYSDVFGDIRSSDDKSKIVLRDSEIKTTNHLQSGIIDMQSSRAHVKNTIAKSISLQDSLLLSKHSVVDNLRSSHSLISGSIKANTIDANDSFFMLYQDKGKPVYSGFGGSIIAYDDISGANNKLQIINLNLSGIDGHFVPLLIAKSKNGIKKDYFQIQTTKNLSRFGIDPKYYAFERIGDYYVAGIGDISLLGSDRLEHIIAKLKDPSIDYEDELVDIINGTGSNDWVQDGDSGLVYIGPDEAVLNSHKDFMKSKISAIYILQNSLFKRLGDLHHSDRDGIWTRYYKGKVSYKDTTTSYKSKSIGFDSNKQYDGYKRLAGVFVYDLHSNAKDFSSTSYGVGGYLSMIWDSGAYMDSVLRYTDHNDYVNSSYLGKIFSDYYTIMAGIEGGYTHSFGNGFYIKPSAELFYSYHPSVVNTISGSILTLDKINDLSADISLKAGYRHHKAMIGAGAGMYFDIRKMDKYSLCDGYECYKDSLSKDKRLNVDVFGSYQYNKDLTFSFDMKKSFLSDFKLDYEANFNIRYQF